MKEVFTKHGFTTAAIDLIVGNLVVEGETSLRKFQTYLGYLAALDPARQTSWQDVFASVRSLGVSEPAMPKWMDMMEVQLRQAAASTPADGATDHATLALEREVAVAVMALARGDVAGEDAAIIAKNLKHEFGVYTSEALDGWIAGNADKETRPEVFANSIAAALKGTSSAVRKVQMERVFSGVKETPPAAAGTEGSSCGMLAKRKWTQALRGGGSSSGGGTDGTATPTTTATIKTLPSMTGSQAKYQDLARVFVRGVDPDGNYGGRNFQKQFAKEISVFIREHVASFGEPGKLQQEIFSEPNEVMFATLANVSKNHRQGKLKERSEKGVNAPGRMAEGKEYTLFKIMANYPAP